MSDKPTPGDVVPTGAIAIGNGAYMVPIGRDPGGCATYRMYAPGRGVPDVIFYADGKGGFTMNRDAADCGGAKPPAKPR